MMTQLEFCWRMDGALECCLLELVKPYCEGKRMIWQELGEVRRQFLSFIAMSNEHSTMCMQSQIRSYLLKIYIARDTESASEAIFTCSIESERTSGT